jgi:hypothetical protein
MRISTWDRAKKIFERGEPKNISLEGPRRSLREDLRLKKTKED